MNNKIAKRIARALEDVAKRIQRQNDILEGTPGHPGFLQALDSMTVFMGELKDTLQCIHADYSRQYTTTKHKGG